MDDRILHHLLGCDEIWHAGDIGDLSVMDQLGTIAPVRAVHGNIDNDKVRVEFKKDHRFTLDGMRVWMTHIGGKPPRYNKEVYPKILRDRPNLFICGHSHICKVEWDKKMNMLYMNPGAAGLSGFHKIRTLLRFEILGGKVSNLEVVELGPRSQIMPE
jgi:uncharacterized protein